MAAVYFNGGKKYRALLYHDPEGHPAYYTADGKSLQKAFLRSPLKFGAPVTSHFSKARYHPILKMVRLHLGTDYGAPVGTPVQTIGSGRVLFVGRKSGDGNMVRIAHSSDCQNIYLHLSKMFVHAGEHVEIGKTIGLVGSTGLAIGRHLDFRITQKGSIQEFRETAPSALRPRSQNEHARICRRPRSVAVPAREAVGRSHTNGANRSDRHSHDASK